MSNIILFVDDDPNFLSACKRSLRSKFEVETALGGASALELIAKSDPFAVIVADMRMPEMDGVQFLSKVKDMNVDSVCMMLTGNADLGTAISAVNEGHIFRFLTKPCARGVLAQSVGAAVRYYELIVAEKQLLEQTLKGSVKVMADILSLVNPRAFGRASRVRRLVCQIAERLNLADIWQIEVAAMLSQIGCVSLPEETLAKACAGQELTPEERKLYASHPDVGGRLIVNIPRLENAAHMIARQQEPFSWDRSSQGPRERDEVAVGGHVLKVALDLDQLLSHGASPEQATETLRQQPDIYDSDIVDAVAGLKPASAENQRRLVTVAELDAQMILDQDVRTCDGRLLVTRGQEVTLPILEHFRRWAAGVGIEQPVRVLVPISPAEVSVPATVGL